MTKHTNPTRRGILRVSGISIVVASSGCTNQLGESGPTIQARDGVLIDEELELRVEDLDAGTEVRIRAALRDVDVNEEEEDGSQFESYATFEADDNGIVDPADTAPIKGTYEGVAPKGLVWSMHSREELDDPAEELVDPSDENALDITFWAMVDGEEVARSRVSRPRFDENIRELELADDLAGRCFVPPESGPHPGVLVLHGGGEGQLMVSYARLLASRGFAAFAAQYFGPGETEIPPRQREVPLEYFDRAIEWLTEQEEVTDGPVGALGGSLGGELSLLLGAHSADIGAVVCYNGPSYITHFDVFETSPWAVDEEPLSYIEVDWDDGEEIDIDGTRAYATRPAHEAALERADEESLNAARIPVEEIDAPVLCVAGADDRVLPSDDAAQRVVQRLDDHDHPYDYEALIYEDAGHSILPLGQPTAPRIVSQVFPEDGLRAGGGTPRGIAEAEVDHWPRVQEYLKAGLE
jgi:dienelactone hydrolase